MPARLPETLRTAVIQKWLEGLSRDKIAEECNVSTGAVSGMIDNWKKYGVGIQLGDQHRDLALGLKKFGISVSQCADGFRTHQVLSNLGVDMDDLRSFITEIYNRSRHIGLSPREISESLSDLVSFAANTQSIESEGEEANSTQVVYISQIPAYITRMKEEKARLRKEIAQLGDEKQAKMDEKATLEQDIDRMISDKGITKENLDWYCQVRAKLAEDGFQVEQISRLMDALKFVQEAGYNLSEITRTYSKYQTLVFEKSSLEREILKLQELARSAEQSIAELRRRMDSYSLTLSIIDELTRMGFNYKNLKRLHSFIVEVGRANGLPINDEIALSRFMEDLATDYDELLGLKARIETLRTQATRLALEVRMQRGIYDAMPHVGSSFGLLRRMGIREDQVVKVAALLERHPDVVESLLQTSNNNDDHHHPDWRGSSAFLSKSPLTSSSSRSSSSPVLFTRTPDADANKEKTNPPTANSRDQYIGSEPTPLHERGLGVDIGQATTSASRPKSDTLEQGTTMKKRAQPAEEVYCQQLEITDITASGSSDDNLASNIGDNNFNTMWFHRQVGCWIQLNLGSRKKICRVDIAWHQGDLQRANFVISVSEDHINFDDKISTRSESAAPTFEKYTLPSDTYGRYLRIAIKGGKGNDYGKISEIAVFGHAQ